MIRLFNAYFPTRTVVLGVTEALLVALAFMVATILWMGAAQANFMLVYENGFLKIALVSTVLVLSMYYFDLYDSIVLSNWREIMTRLVQVLGTACIILAFLYYLYPSLEFSRAVFGIGLLLVSISLAVWRRLFLLLNRTKKMSERTVVLGDGPLALALSEQILSRPELGINLLGYIGQPEAKAAAATTGATRDPAVPRQSSLNCVGDVTEIAEVVKRDSIARVIVTLADRRGRLPVETLLGLKTKGILIQDGTDVYESVTGKVALDSLRASWLLFSDGFCASRFMLVYKRVFDILWASVGLILTAPLFAIIAIAIRLDSPGPAIFRQKRVGQDGKIFTLVKFRSMAKDAGDIDVHVPAQDDDPRITRVGNILRRLRLDELPQLYNILRGDMSFIGPRPFVPDQEEGNEKAIPFYSQRWAVKPGASGWAQVHRGYCSTLEDNIEKLSYDLFYIKNMSIGLDLLIMFYTVKILLLGRGGK